MAGPTRVAVLRAVADFPGIHVREMERHLGLSSRLAAYHLGLLEEEGAVQRVQETGYARYFPALGRPRWSRRDVAFLCLMRRAAALHVTLLLLAAGELGRAELAQRLRLAPASVSYHLDLLQRAGVVVARTEGRKRQYALRDEAYARGVLANFTPLPDELEPFESVWSDLFG
ncbi:MAG TPA: ArsR family transcriptional regulator [Candidatus Thermoplasmatota archaeon]|nr:ArsR family transcriptional regulator [Candidatus Thermoplasmatota archaeon]